MKLIKRYLNLEKNDDKKIYKELTERQIKLYDIFLKLENDDKEKILDSIDRDNNIYNKNSDLISGKIHNKKLIALKIDLILHKNKLKKSI